MLKNYLRMASRALQRNKGFSLINISGLAVGMTCCMLIFLYVHNELSYDSFNKKEDRIYRIDTDFKRQGKIVESIFTSPLIGPTLKEEYPEVEEAVRVTPFWQNALFKVGTESFYENQFYFADPNIFKVFSFTLLEGQATAALTDPNSIVIDKEKAAKYFGNENPLGKTLSVELFGQMRDFKVTGVLNDIPGPSSITPHFMVSFKNIGYNEVGAWWGFGYVTYLLLNKGSSAANLENKLPAFMRAHMPIMEGVDGLPQLHLQSLSDIHLHSDTTNGDSKLSPSVSIYLFIVLALFILSIASINFMNLSTAKSQVRAKEVGIRKVVGSTRSQLVKQFLLESSLTTFLSLMISFVLFELLLPVFNELVGENLSLNYATGLVVVVGFLAIALLVGLASGMYPAFFLSRFKPIEVLKGKTSTKAGGAKLREALVIAQFSISIVLILGTIMVRSQLEYIKNKGLGFDKENVVVMPFQSQSVEKSAEVIKTEILSNSDVVSATLSSVFPYGNDNDWWLTNVSRRRTSSNDDKIFYTFQVDYDFFRTLDARIIAGRDFARSLSSDSGSFILNETAVKEFGWNSPEEAIGKTMSWFGNGPNNPKTGNIIGVVKDFNFKSLRERIRPSVFQIMPGSYNLIAVRIRPNTTERILGFFKETFKKFDNLHPFEFSFLDEDINSQYKFVEKLSVTFTIFSSLAIFIACLGLFGLVSFTTEQRTKEIGIRKVLGASVSEIIFMLIRELAKWVIIANLIAWPIAYYFMNGWLRDFAYRINIGVTMFIFAGVFALLIALFTVSYHAIKAATANPVESLRYE
jgi:putative ABC transport system permease protein